MTRLGRTRRLSRLASSLVLTLTSGAWLVLSAIPASAELTACALAGATATLTIDATATPDVLARDATGVVTIDGAVLPGACSGVTVNNVETIVVNGGGGTDEILSISLANGGFVDSGGAEVDIQVDLDTGTDTLQILGTSGADNLVVGTNGINLTSDADADLTGQSTAETIIVNGADGDDTMSGAGGFGTGAASADAVTFNGGNGNDILVGGDGADTINGDAGNDIVTGGPGSDVALTGGEGADIITAGAGDTAVGGPGADTLTATAAGATVGYQGSSAGVTVDLADSNTTTAGDQQAASGGDATGDELTDFDNVVGSDHDDTLHGNDGANELRGGSGEDALTGGLGNDTLVGGDGDDVYDEGDADSGSDHVGGNDTIDAGSDTVDYSARTVAVVVTTTNAIGDGQDANGNEVAEEDDDADVENVWGGAGDDTITGDAGPNIIAGNGGAADTLDGAAGSDTLEYSAGTARVRVNLSAGTASGGDAEGDTFANFENVNGGSGNDSLTGDNDANALSGGAGNDKFVGRGGDDDIDGGRGKDRVDYSASASDVVVNLKKRVGAGITEGTDTLSRLENIKGTLFNDTLVGNDAANLIIAGDGNDIIKALGGNDKLKGGAGNDRINGGPGRDRCKGGPGKDQVVKCER